MTDVLYFHTVNISHPPALLFNLKTAILCRMKKEVILAIVLGLFFGLLITFGLYQANSVKTVNTIDNNSTSPTPTPTTSVSNLSIIEPTDGAVLATATATLRGATDPNYFVLVFDESSEYFVKPDDTGLFFQEITLDPGTNLIDVYVFDDKTEIDHQQLNLVFTTNL